MGPCSFLVQKSKISYVETKNKCWSFFFFPRRCHEIAKNEHTHVERILKFLKIPVNEWAHFNCIWKYSDWALRKITLLRFGMFLSVIQYDSFKKGTSA